MLCGPILARVPIVLRPTAPVAADALLPGDPGRALALAQALLTEPRMSNHAHGLWGYSGETAAGRPLTIQATGIGGPSAALVLGDLAELGVRRAVRVGTCVGLVGDIALADTVLCERALAADGTSRALGAAGDGVPAERRREWIDAGAVAVEMQAATLFALGARLGVAIACLLVVSDLAGERGRQLGEAELEAAALAGARLAERALAL